MSLRTIIRPHATFSNTSISIYTHYYQSIHRRFSTTIKTTPLSTGGHVAHLWLEGPKKYPILTPEATLALTHTIRGLETDVDLRGLFLRSTIAGADLTFMRDIAGPKEAKEFIRLIDELCSAIQNFPDPVIAICEGPCLGAGLEVAMSADVRLAVGTPDTVFGMPETRVGIPSVVQACLLPGLVGWARARQMLYFGEKIGFSTALKWGLVSWVFGADKIDSAVEDWEEKIARTGVNAVKAQKRLMMVWEEKGVGRGGIEAGVEEFGRAFEGEEPRKMMEEFFREKEKRKAVKEQGTPEGGEQA